MMWTYFLLMRRHIESRVDMPGLIAVGVGELIRPGSVKGVARAKLFSMQHKVLINVYWHLGQCEASPLPDSNVHRAT